MVVSGIETRVREELAASGFVYELIDCDPELADTVAFCAHYGYPLEQSANTIMVASRRPEGHYAACVVLAVDRLDVNKRVRKLLGVQRLSFAAPEVTAEVTGMLMGGVTPFGLPASLPLWIDARVMEHEWVILGGGSRSLKVKVSPAIFEKLPNAEVIAGLSLERA